MVWVITYGPGPSRETQDKSEGSSEDKWERAGEKTKLSYINLFPLYAIFLSVKFWITQFVLFIYFNETTSEAWREMIWKVVKTSNQQSDKCNQYIPPDWLVTLYTIAIVFSVRTVFHLVTVSFVSTTLTCLSLYWFVPFHPQCIRNTVNCQQAFIYSCSMNILQTAEWNVNTANWYLQLHIQIHRWFMNIWPNHFPCSYLFPHLKYSSPTSHRMAHLNELRGFNTTTYNLCLLYLFVKL